MADFVSISVKGAQKLSNNFRADALRADQQALAITRMYGSLLATSVKAHASGRPGPRTVTGDYRRSITSDVRREGGTAIATVGTTRPQGRRLELGFVGVDALGRHYNQPPFPHFRPALSKIEDAYTLALGGIVRRLG
jgi:hypothetical protein